MITSLRRFSKLAACSLALAGLAGAQQTAQGPPPPLNDDCMWAWWLIGEGTAVWQNDFTPTTGFDGGGTSSNGGQDCSYAIYGDMFYVWEATAPGDYMLDTTGSLVVDTVMHVHLGTDCAATCIEGNDDYFGPNGHSAVILCDVQVGDQFLVQMGSKDLADMGIGYLNASLLPVPACTVTTMCEPGQDHYLGGNVTLGNGFCECGYQDVSGTNVSSGVGSGLHLGAVDGPPGQFGFFLMGSDANNALALFEGVLCLDAPQARYNGQVATNLGLPQLNSIGQFDAGGVLQSLTGNGTSAGGSGFDVPNELPFAPPGQVILPGDTWAFQLWYRDFDAGGAPSANFSNAIVVLF
tara:strand:+ start:2847 stop:3899 length:1053 start_codon:yes stop_codon:yes gene_type:complete